MKLIVAGASGFVGAEIVRQALADPRVTHLIALSRSPLTPQDNLAESADNSKFHNVVVEDYGSYSDDAKKEFQGVDGVLWTVGITPRKQRGTPAEEVRRVCVDCALTGLQTAYEASAPSTRGTDGKPKFRFTYMSGVGSERDPNKKPNAFSFMHEYCWMRGDAEKQILAFPATHPGAECQVPRPGAINAEGQYLKIVRSFVLNWAAGLPSVDVTEVAAAMLEQIIEGYSMDTLENKDLLSIGKEALLAKQARNAHQ